MASEGLHEDAGLLSAEVIERHRAITSLMEELEAVDWYDQRVAATTDESLRSVLAHNRDEEKEIGYLEHNAERVLLYLEESFTFQVLTPEAAVHLRYQ